MTRYDRLKSALMKFEGGLSSVPVYSPLQDPLPEPQLGRCCDYNRKYETATLLQFWKIWSTARRSINHNHCGVDWCTGRVSDSGPRGPRFDPQPGRRLSRCGLEHVTIPQLLGQLSVINCSTHYIVKKKSGVTVI